ncbi:MAG TPA: asparagine synthase-related protein, partial [Gemmatimonadaceae bacterium]
MSGLVALLHRDGRPVEPGVVWEMLRAIPYRGPDGMWLRVWDDVALGFAKLAITPEEIDEEQPLVSPRTGCAVTADVRLDNRPDLLAQLPDRLPPSTSDAELILRAYETWGTDLVDHLLGDFAVVIWDPRQRQLVLARDTSGQRTLFYRADAHTFAAASEIQQLLQDPAVPVRPNEQRIRAYLTPFWTYQNEKQGTATFYEGILALPPGHAMVVQGRAVRVWRYWELETREIRYRTADEYAEHYLALLSEVVRTRLRTSSPIGALLSGGLDSSSIVAVAHELFRSGSAHNGGFTTFTSAFDGLECDERPLIEDLRDKYGFRAEFVDCGAFGGRLQPEAAGFKESPNMGVGEARDAILGAAHQAGVRVLLTGDTADACVGGTRLVLDSLLRQGQLDAFWHQL